MTLPLSKLTLGELVSACWALRIDQQVMPPHPLHAPIHHAEIQITLHGSPPRTSKSTRIRFGPLLSRTKADESNPVFPQTLLNQHVAIISNAKCVDIDKRDTSIQDISVRSIMRPYALRILSEPQFRPLQFLQHAETLTR